MSAIKSPFLGNDKATLKPRYFVEVQGKNRPAYDLYENGKRKGRFYDLKRAQRWARS